MYRFASRKITDAILMRLRHTPKLSDAEEVAFKLPHRDPSALAWDDGLVPTQSCRAFLLFVAGVEEVSWAADGKLYLRAVRGAV